ncbi:MlaD family protein [Nibrella viscosa]|uniref:MlaD family protein n=1 Tax=Nibrella viscosa TaxID=1084524 RepID=A0ABP8KPZ6_9BACT
MLGGQQKRFTKNIQVTATFDDVSGLKVGNNVWFSGVKIGTVRTLRFIGNSQVEVGMNIEEKSAHFIRKDAKATISSEGFIGNKLVMLVGGTTRFPTIEDGDRLQTEAALSADQIMETLQENNQNLLKVTTDFTSLMNRIKQGKGTIGAILMDSVMANNVRATVANLQRTSTNAAQVSGSLNQYAAKLNTRGTLANDLVTDTAIMARLRTSANQIQQATSTAVTMANNLEQTTEKVNRKIDNPNSPLGVLLTDESTARSLKGTIRNMESSTQKLDENMEALQHNFLFRGFFRKRAKEQEQQEKNRTRPATQTAVQQTVDTMGVQK